MKFRQYSSLLILFLIVQIGCNTCHVAGISREEVINYIFNSSRYRHNERPYEANQTRVMVFIKVIAINSVNVSNMEYSTDLYLRQQWIDSRLRWENLKNLKSYNVSITSPSLKERLWLPDLFFRNGKEGYVHKMTLPNYLLRLQPTGEVLYSQKITMRFSCQMDLQTYPMDSQVCEMDIGSYGYTLDQLRFYWRRESPLIIGANVQIPEFNEPYDIGTSDCTNSSSTSTGVYTCLKTRFTLRRQLGSYLVSTFIPNTLIVIVSWLNFWVSVDAVPARITLGLLTLLGILTQASGISGNLPRVSYIKAIDVWLIACIVFVIGALLEFAVASTVAQHRKLTLWKTEVRQIVRQELSRWNLAIQRQQMHQIQSAKTLNRKEMEFCEELDLLLSAQSDPLHNSAGFYYRQQQSLPSQQQQTYNLYSQPDLHADLHNLPGDSYSSGGGGAPSHQIVHRKRRKSLPEESMIDIYSRYLFPSFFVFYNFCYWIYYLLIVSQP